MKTYRFRSTVQPDHVDTTFGRGRARLLIGALLLCACSGDDGPSGSEMATAETGDGDGDPGDGDPGDGDPGDGDGDPGDGDGDPGDGDGDPGECYDIVDETIPPAVERCELPKPCDEAEWASDDFLCIGEPVYDPAVAECIIATLVAGEAAAVWFSDCPGGQFSSYFHLQMFGDGTVVWERGYYEDLGGHGRATWRALPDPAYFEACSVDTPEGLTACLEGMVDTTCQLGEPVCPG